MENGKHRVRRSLLCAGAALVCLGAIAPVLASGTAPQVTVKYDDLNLSTRQGATTLLARIRAAARHVCGEESQRLDLQHAWQLCYDASINVAVAKVDSPILTALAHGQYPGGERAESLKPAMSL
jgi:UrcA family protein